MSTESAASEQRLAFALEAAHVGVWEANLKDGVAYWSAITESQHGLAPGTFAGTQDAFLQCVHADDRQHVLDTLERAMRNREDAEFEYRTVWPDGTERLIRSRARFFFDAAGAPERGAGVSMDITEQRSLEEQYRQAQKMEAVGRLAGGIAHDFNNMLMAILGNADFLLEDTPADDPRRRDLQEIVKAAQRAQALTHQLLVFSRRQHKVRRVVHLGDIIEAVTPMLRTLTGETVSLRTTVANHRYVKADAGHIEQLLMNLAVNARDAMKDGGRLTIETTDVDLDASYVRLRPGLAAGRYVLLTVSDTGCGMDAVTRKRIFEPFFTTKPEGEGTGLGLATVYAIVKESGGHIAVDSEPGHGTTFLVYLPETEEAPAVAVDARYVQTPHGTETVLVVEDEAAVRGLVTRVLEQLGYTVHASGTPSDAISFATANTGIDVILTDVVLPDMNGPAMIGELRTRAVSPAVVYMSGYADETLRPLNFLTPSTPFLRKPFTGHKLATAIRQALDAPVETGAHP